MQIDGEDLLDAPIDCVWQALNDPAVLARCVPGVTALVPTGPDAYDAEIKLAIGPLKGTFKGTVRITEQVPPEAMTLTVDGAAPMGGVNAAGRLALETQGTGTLVRWQAEPKLRGTLATVGARLIGPVSKQQTTAFLKAIEAEARQLASSRR